MKSFAFFLLFISGFLFASAQKPFTANTLTFDSSLLKIMLDAVPAKLDKDTKYGLGVILRPTVLGNAYVHSGSFPGYLTEMYYFPDYKFCIAMQVLYSYASKYQ